MKYSWAAFAAVPCPLLRPKHEYNYTLCHHHLPIGFTAFKTHPSPSYSLGQSNTTTSLPQKKKNSGAEQVHMNHTAKSETRKSYKSTTTYCNLYNTKRCTHPRV